MTKKIAVIGGGVGAMTAVWGLLQDPDWKEKYEITVYQMGWRLGGKGASGRNMAEGARIEEHGLHVWAGFYENAFRNMRACYAELTEMGLRDPEAPLGTFEAAFKPLDHLFLAEKVGEEWRPWLIDLPTNDKLPGTGNEVPAPWVLFLRALKALQKLIETGTFGKAQSAESAEAARRLSPLKAAHLRLLTLARTMPMDPRAHKASVNALLGSLIRGLQSRVHKLETPENLENDATRRALYLLDLGLACARGLVESRVFLRGYDILDQWEFTDWLRGNGASEAVLDSVLMRGCYDFVFGFHAGDIHDRNAGAGTAIRAMGRLTLTYCGAIFWKMQAGMGDTIFGPYYQVMRAKGVKFEFFSAATALRIGPANTGIGKIEMVRQARLAGDSYDPFVTVRGLPCWPSEPLWDQLENGEELRASGINFEHEAPTGQPFTLERGRDFDTLILGASMGSLPYLTKDLAKASPRWKRMLDEVQTVGTHAAQFWMTETADALGWRDVVQTSNPPEAIPNGPLRTVITGFAEPLDTWADMSHLLDREDWPNPGPASIAYFCAPAPDGETLPEFRADLAQWTETELPKLWPNLPDVADPFYPPGRGLAGQYARVNMEGSERYVLSTAGSVFHRLAPDESGFDNLYLAGDWTRCGLNAGCVEAATMSGLAAANAISGQNLPINGGADISSNSTIASTAKYQSLSATAAGWPLDGFYAKGKMTGWFMFYAMPRAEVEALLPPGLHLGASDLVEPGYHPVGLSFCHYEHVRGSFVPGFMAMKPYGEATFAIPGLRSDETGQADLLYPRRLYVNNPSAIAAGKLFYAMNKKPATIQQDAATFVATDPSGLSLEAQFQERDETVFAPDHPAFGAITQLLGTAFVTRTPLGQQLFNAFNLELSNCWIAPASGQVRVRDPDPLGFPAYEGAVPALGPKAPRGLPGAFRIWSSWSMTNPLDSRRVAKAAEAEAWLRETY
ncbi:NAD(P)-binding protein [Pseudooceanicola sp. CBS1P-1]|uniref:NAD(P)-binding protein n=1 Tax=Pseudooceanicola albus TaxID=2692189 RepID=A0A6L7G5E7_9RHOB|nr:MULTISPECIES: NAD(P)-binding protein [Pseudooceanicola]MBT9385128.1 NAD(P)-binding protein [Pseudooceanicola endophyticus]MXN18580.1 NAD(P)-binding protein [Pseudooceanicola albus]